MKITKQTLIALHALLDGVVLAGLASLLPGPPRPFPISAAAACFVCAPPLFYITRRKMARESDDLGLFVDLSQIALIIAWLLSLCFLIIVAMFMTAFVSSGGPN